MYVNARGPITHFDGFITLSILWSYKIIKKKMLTWWEEVLNSPASTVTAYKLGKHSEFSSFVILFLVISFSLAYGLRLCDCCSCKCDNELANYKIHNTKQSLHICKCNRYSVVLFTLLCMWLWIILAWPTQTLHIGIIHKTYLLYCLWFSVQLTNVFITEY